MEDIKLAVKKGAYWLDQVYPEWLGQIDLGTLQLIDQKQCVLGQLGGDYFHFFRFAGSHWGENDTYQWMQEHGFTTFDDYGELTEAWTEYIEEHR